MPSLNKNPATRWHTFTTLDELESSATQAILDAAHQAIAVRGLFRIVLAGGTTPRKVYQRLRDAKADWSAWHVYFGDERCLPPDEAERNSRMAQHAWLDHVAIPRAQIHAIPAERGAETAASDYAKILKDIDQFDLVLLGLGEDGHTASLFPGQNWGTTENAPAALAVHNAPKPPPDRVSLSAHRLSATRRVMFLVTGASKQQAVNEWRNGVNIPATSITPQCGIDVNAEGALM